MEDRGYDVTADFYERLGLNVDAPQEVLNASYRALAKKYHPDIDKSEGAEKRYKDVQDAYDYLCDEKRRAEYNSWISSEVTEDMSGYVEIDPSDNGKKAKAIQRAFYKSSTTRTERILYRLKIVWQTFLIVFYFLLKIPVAVAFGFGRFLMNCLALPFAWLIFKVVLAFIGIIASGFFAWVFQKSDEPDYMSIIDFIFNHGNVVYTAEIIGLLIAALLVAIISVWDDFFS